MNDTLALPGAPTRATARPPRSLDRDTRLLLHLLAGLSGGTLELTLPGGALHRFGSGAPVAHLTVHDAALFSAVLARGDIGLAESYLDGHWDSPDPPALLTLFARNRQALRRAVYGQWPRLIAARLKHWLNGNSRRGSRRNILAHYDLGNDFYAEWQKIYKVKHGKAMVIDFKSELCAGCGVCVEACPHDVIRLAGRGSVESRQKLGNVLNMDKLEVIE